MEYREQAIDLLIKFRNCKLDTNKMPAVTESGSNYVLMIMADGQPKTASALADEMNVSMARVTTLIQKMEDKHLVERQVSKEDKRVSYITLTEEGQKASYALIERSIRIISELIRRLGVNKLEEFIDMLYVVRDIVEEDYKEVPSC